MNCYTVILTQSAKEDILNREKYILNNFKYRELAINYSRKMKKAINGLSIMPSGYESTGFIYRGYSICFKPFQTYLIFFTVNDILKTVTVLRVLQDGQNWKYIIKQWLS